MPTQITPIVIDSADLHLETIAIDLIRASAELLGIRMIGDFTARDAIGEWTAVEDGDTYRVQLRAAGNRRATADERAVFKSHGFRWAPSVGAWQRKITNAADAIDALITMIREDM